MQIENAHGQIVTVPPELEDEARLNAASEVPQSNHTYLPPATAAHNQRLQDLYHEWVDKTVRITLPKHKHHNLIGRVYGVDPSPLRYVGSSHASDGPYLCVVIGDLFTHARPSDVEVVDA